MSQPAAEAGRRRGPAPAEDPEPDAAPRPGTGRLKGKIALVTGGGTGIGRAVAMLFAREGASVVVAGRRSEPLQETIQEIRRGGGTAAFARGDVSRADRAEMIVQAAVYNFGGLDVLVNAAGVRASGTILDTDERRWDRILATNLKGPFLVSRLAAAAMRRRGGGSIVNVADAVALRGVRGAAAYAASKGGLVALTRSMALDLAADRIRVNAVCPGAVDTPMARDPAQGGGDALIEVAAREHPLGRAGTPADVAWLALYLASDESSWITGAVFPMDGGAAPAPEPAG
jgi:NAD(P)-dependent dehydrogenase (short-subunit alcohol dehydrogenase family)